MPTFYEVEERPVFAETIITGDDPDKSHADYALWRPIFAGRVREDLSALTQDRMLKMARYLYFTNPLARAIVDLKTAFIIGGGLSFETKDEKVNEVLRRFWDDPINDWAVRLPRKVRDLCIDGELYMPATVNEMTGFTRVGFINPLDVAKINVDRNNVELLRTVELKEDVAKKKGEIVKLKVINYDDRKKRRDGQIFVFTVNKSSDSSRGISDLLCLVDWLGLYDQLLFNSLERTSHMNAWYWDVLLEDYSDDQIQEWLNKQQGTSLKGGSIRAHNQKVKWNAVAPDLGSSDIESKSRTFKLQIISGAGLPESFFGEATESRASLTEAQESSFKMLQMRQDYVKHMVASMFEFVIDTAIAKKTLIKDVNRTFSISMPKISVRDLQRGGGAVYRFSQALEIGVKHGWLDKEQADSIFSDVLSVLGFLPEETDSQARGEKDGTRRRGIV